MDKTNKDLIKKLKFAIRNIEHKNYKKAYVFILSVAYYLEEKLVGSKKQ